MNTDQRQATMLLHHLKGPALSIIIALKIFGCLNGTQLQDITGWSKDSITTGLNKLQIHNMIYQVDQRRGWKLSNGIKQLSLNLTASLGSESEGIIDQNEDKFLKFRNFPPSSSSLSINTNNDLREEERKKNPNPSQNLGTSPKPVDNPVDNSRQAQITDWLLRAKIGRNSKKFKEILAANPHPDYIRAHVLYFEWWQNERQRNPQAKIDGRKSFTVGTLITRILANDPAPPPPPSPGDELRQHIPEDLKDIIRR